MNKSAAFFAPVLALFGVFGAGRPAWAVGGFDTAGCYRFSDTIAPLDANAPTFSFTDISATGTLIMSVGADSVPLGDDEVSGAIPIGFPFNFYGTGYSEVFVSSNGFLSFLSRQGSAFQASRIPNPAAPNGIVAGLWTDLVPGGNGGKIYYQTLGTRPNRRFIVQFNKVSFFSGPPATTWEIILLEAGHQIQVQYVTAGNDSQSASAGIENARGTVGLEWKSSSTSFFTLSNVAVRYFAVGGGDTDGDGVPDCIDNCRTIFNPNQADFDHDGIGDACDQCQDSDHDGFGDPGFPANTCPVDNCPNRFNPDQTDTDQDGFGDACDGEPTPSGSEFRVNTTTTGYQGYPRPVVAADASANFVVVWASGPQYKNDIFAQRYDSAGTPQGSEFRVNSTTTGDQYNPAVARARAPSGSFVVVWDGAGASDTAGVFGQRYSSAGTAQGGEFRVNTYTAGTQGYPAVAADGAGNFVVVWSGAGAGDPTVCGGGTRNGQPCATNADCPTQPGPTCSGGGVFGQRYSSAGTAQGGEFRVNTYTTGAQKYPAVAADGAGNFLVVWEGAGASDDAGIFGQRYNSTGTPQGGEFRVNTTVLGRQSSAAVASYGAGNFVVVWAGNGAGDAAGIFGQRFDGAGTAQGGEFLVNTYTTGNQGYPVVAADTTGSFVVAWESFREDGDSFGVFGQRFDSGGLRLGSEFQVNTHTDDEQASAGIAGAAGKFVVVWRSYGQDGSYGGVFGQRFGLCGNHDVDPGEQCDGGPCCSSTCAFQPAGTVCRASAGACDVAETCSGTSATCPANAFKPAGTVCRGAAGACDVAETCSGTSATCPANAFKPNGTACNDGKVCTTSDQCQNGVCTGTNLPNGTSCNDGNSCTTSDHCQSGLCVGTVLPDGSTCNDGNSCTSPDTCTAGVCKGKALQNGTACNDGNSCTTGDNCQSGVCRGTCQVGAVCGSGCSGGHCALNGSTCSCQ